MAVHAPLAVFDMVSRGIATGVAAKSTQINEGPYPTEKKTSSGFCAVGFGGLMESERKAACCVCMSTFLFIYS